MTAADALDQAQGHALTADRYLAEDDTPGDRFHAAQAHAQTSLAWVAIAAELTMREVLDRGGR